MIDNTLTDEELDSLSEDQDLNSKYLVFIAGDKEYALPIRYVTEIVEMQPITEVPDMENYVLGIINLRGRGIPVLDMRIRMNTISNYEFEKSVIIIINVDENYIGIVCCGVREVVNIQEASIQPVLDKNIIQSYSFLTGYAKTEKSMILLIDIKLFIKLCIE